VTDNNSGQEFETDEPEREALVANAPDGQSGAERAALMRLREALLATEPTIDPELVRGDTLDELDASFKAARAAVARVREAIRMEQAAMIPAGAPGRAVPGPATALEKIKAGLAAR
jgi:hypothetical protein